MSTTTTNMGLTVPTVSTTPGPDYASEINSDMQTIDTHDHSTGKGVQITPAGINVNSDFSFNSNNATNLRSTRFVAQGSPLAAASDLGCCYVSGSDLYYNDTGGNQIRITQSGAIAGSPGSISSLTSPASASYNAGATKFVWQSAALTAADMDFRSAIFRNSGASSFGMTVAAPTLSGDLSLTLPTVPAATSFQTIDSSGVMSTGPVTNAGITRNYLAAVNQKVSSASVSFASLSSAAMTYLSVTIGCYGRPVMLMFISDGSTTAGFVNGVKASGTGSMTQTTYVIKYNGFTVSLPFVSSLGNASSYTAPGSMNFIHYGASVGSNTYTFGVQSTNGSSAGPDSVTMVAYEL